MAQGIDHPFHNFTFHAPPGQEDRIGDLKVYVTWSPAPTSNSASAFFDKNSGRYMTSVTSCWELEDHEIEEIVRTKRVMVNFLGGGLMAHYVTSESQMKQFVTDYGKTW